MPEVTPEQHMQLENVNSEVNALPFNDTPGVGEPPDWWSDEPAAGRSWVCRDYVLAKEDRLHALGWPTESMTIILCWVEDPPGGYHATLGVQLPGDEVTILDSRADETYLMSAPPLAYKWDRRQIAGTTEFEPVA
jgi:predicted transglutaminase-like cysteine proteinase